VPTGGPRRVAYLGPEGTFSEVAVRRAVPAAEALPALSVADALDAVRGGAADAAMVPFENSVEGSVAETLDELATGEPLLIAAEVLVPVTFALLARPGSRLPDVRHVHTVPIAEAQCRRWLRRYVPAAELHPTASTAQAAADVATVDSVQHAAIAAPIAGERYGLAALAEDVCDVPGAVTRFALVGRPDPPPAPTGHDRTTVVAFIADDHPGALLSLLTEFALREVNLTRIESRPTGGGLGRYYFSIDCVGHIADERVGEALAGLHRRCSSVRFLGSYPCADRADAAPSDAAFREANRWLQTVRSGGTGG
jgi:prephenate dehydratase